MNIQDKAWLVGCTLTGLDERVSLEQVVALARRFPFVEWGVLYWDAADGSGRYPGREWIERLVEDEATRHLRLALHVCGRRAVHTLLSEPETWVARYSRLFGRVQVNFRHEHYDIEVIRAFVRTRAPQVIITQHNKANRALAGLLAGEPNHVCLFDSSGGKGVLAAAWPPALSDVACGYAGGLGPSNVAEQIASIAQSAVGPYWIDMEGKLRTPSNDLDLVACEQVLEAVSPFIANSAASLT
jgi:phosphoribosylanthranilate isomerase